MSVKVLVVDDHEVIRRGLAVLLEGSEIEIVAEAGDGDEVVKKTRAKKPDLILMDVRMTGMDGLTALKKVRKSFPNIPVVMLSTYDNPTYVARSVALGAADFVLKSAPKKDLIRAITRAVAGDEPDRNSSMTQIQTIMETRTDNDSIPLTKRELQVLRHIALGLSNKEIAHSLDISVETVKEHVQNILRKIDASDRTQAAVWAVKGGLV